MLKKWIKNNNVLECFRKIKFSVVTLPAKWFLQNNNWTACQCVYYFLSFQVISSKKIFMILVRSHKTLEIPIFITGKIHMRSVQITAWKNNDSSSVHYLLNLHYCYFRFVIYDRVHFIEQIEFNLYISNRFAS